MADDDRDPGPSVASKHVAWLDAVDASEARAGATLVRRSASLIAAIVIFARIFLLYLVVPLTFMVLLVAVLLYFRLPPFVGGVIFAVGLGFGLAVYYDVVLR